MFQARYQPLLLVARVYMCSSSSLSTRFVAGPDWVDYDDEDDAYDTYSASSNRELVEVPGVSVRSVDVVQNVLPGGYGNYGGRGGGNLPNPYGMSPSPRAGIPSPPPTPTPPAAVSAQHMSLGCTSSLILFSALTPKCMQAATASYSTSATVPGVKSTATLSSYGTVADFNDNERTRVCSTQTCLLSQCPELTVLVLTAVRYNITKQHLQLAENSG